MSMINELQQVINKEKKRQQDQLNADVEKKKQNDLAVAKQAALQADNNIFQEYIGDTTNIVGHINENSKTFKEVPNGLSFGDCLTEAYSGTFKPYMAWKKLDTMPDKGMCLLGDYDNDDVDNNSGDIPVYLTPAKQEAIAGGSLTTNFDERVNMAKMDLMKRLKQNLHETNLNLLHEKNKNNAMNDGKIKDNYVYLSNLDKTIFTLTQKIRQNNYTFSLNNKVSKILFYFAILTVLTLLSYVSYGFIKRA